MTKFFNFLTSHAYLAMGFLALSISAPAQAIVYDFKHTGGTFADGSKLLVEVTENLLTQANNDVLFKFTSALPISNSELPPSISGLYFDTGTYSGMFSSMSVSETFGDIVNLISLTPSSHPFLNSVNPFTPEYKFGLSSSYPLDRPINGINPGEYAVLSATLGGGYTFTDVISAMNVGVNSNLAIATTGLRIGEFVYFLNGTGNDDGGFVTKGVVAVPEAETWAMMLAGLGLVGFMLRRRKA